MIIQDELIEAGQFFKTHGLKGELNAQTEYDAEILTRGYPLIIELEGLYVPFYVESVRPKGTFLSLVKIDGIDSCEGASLFVNKKIYLRRTDVAEYLDVSVDELEYEIDLIGYKVYDTAGRFIGEVSGIDDTTDNLLLEVGDLLLPYHDDFIIELDESDRKMVMQLPDGLLEL